MRRKFLTTIMLISSVVFRVQAQKSGGEVRPEQSIGGTYFLLYQVNDAINRFEVKRAYLTYKSVLNKNFSVRFTSDVSRTSSGLSLRLKYAYLKWTKRTDGFVGKLYAEYGLVHRTWISFEENLNPYRVLGYMFVERMNIVNSADLGLTAGVFLGEKSATEHYKGGKYGDFVVGVYNGGGYSVAEFNKNKVVESRLTLRANQNLMLTFAGAYGKTSLPELAQEAGDFWYTGLMFTYDTKPLVFNVQAVKGVGGYNAVNYLYSNELVGVRYYGGSLFYDLVLGKLHQFARFDYLSKSNGTNDKIASSGFGYELNKYVFAVCSYERFLSDNNYLFQIGTKINF